MTTLKVGYFSTMEKVPYRVKKEKENFCSKRFPKGPQQIGPTAIQGHWTTLEKQRPLLRFVWETPQPTLCF